MPLGERTEVPPGGYMHARSFSSSEEDTTRLPDRKRRYRKPVNRYPDSEWVRNIRNMSSGEDDVAVALLDLRYQQG